MEYHMMWSIQQAGMFLTRAHSFTWGHVEMKIPKSWSMQTMLTMLSTYFHTKCGPDMDASVSQTCMLFQWCTGFWHYLGKQKGEKMLYCSTCDLNLCIPVDHAEALKKE